MKLFSPKIIKPSIIQEKKNVIRSKRENLIENIQIHMSWQFLFFLWFENLHKCEK
jgi:hypothetical protein